MLENLCGECVSHFEGVQQGLRKLGIAYEVNSRMVRGLDYYERTAFEFLSGDLGAQNAVAGGGRYDDLVKDLGGLLFSALEAGLTRRDALRFVAAYRQRPWREVLEREGAFWKKVQSNALKLYRSVHRREPPTALLLG